MALIVYTTTPKKLHRLISEEIQEKRVRTWGFDHDGCLRHVAASGQWTDEARVSITVLPTSALVLSIQGPDHKNLSVEAYAVYMGRLAEMLLAHFDKEFTGIQITALLHPPLGDES